MKTPYCPACDQDLKVVPFEDSTPAGYCKDCRVYWPLIIGMSGYEIQRRFWKDDTPTEETADGDSK